MPSGTVSYIDHAADVRFRLSTSAFGGAALDEQTKSIISSLVEEEVARLTEPMRLTISRTSVEITTASQTVRWHIRPDSSLTVTHSTTVSLTDLSTTEPILI